MAEVGCFLADRYMTLPYLMEVYGDPECECWGAELPDLPGLVAAHETREGLKDATEDAKRMWSETAIEGSRMLPIDGLRPLGPGDW